MRQLYKVIKYNEHTMLHEVVDSKSRHLQVDIMVDGTLGEDLDPVSLVGKTVSCDYLNPWAYIGSGTKIEGDSDEAR